MRAMSAKELESVAGSGYGDEFWNGFVLPPDRGETERFLGWLKGNPLSEIPNREDVAS